MVKIGDFGNRRLIFDQHRLSETVFDNIEQKKSLKLPAALWLGALNPGGIAGNSLAHSIGVVYGGGHTSAVIGAGGAGDGVARQPQFFVIYRL